MWRRQNTRHIPTQECQRKGGLDKRGDKDKFCRKCINECYDLTKTTVRLTSVGTTVMNAFYGRTWAKPTYDGMRAIFSLVFFDTILFFFSGFGFIWLRAIGGGNHDIAAPIACWKPIVENEYPSRYDKSALF